MDDEGSTWTNEAVVGVLEASPTGEPYTSGEVAAELGCARTTAYKKLQGLAEAGTLETKKVGAKARGWWLPPESSPGPDGDGREPDRDDEYGRVTALLPQISG